MRHITPIYFLQSKIDIFFKNHSGKIGKIVLHHQYSIFYNLQFTKVRKIDAGKIRGIIPHQPVYIKKMDHSVSEVRYFCHPSSVFIYYVHIYVIICYIFYKFIHYNICISLQAVATMKSSCSCECSFKVRDINMKYKQIKRNTIK